MMTNPASFSQVSAERVQKALQFGWTLAEVNGHLKREQMWGGGKSQDHRIFLSHPKPNSGEALWLALQRLTVLADQLFLVTEKEPSVCPVPDGLEAFLSEVEEKLSSGGDKKNLPDARISDVFNLLDEWSRACWVHLGAESPIMAEAATLGGSLADTYWAVQPPPDEPAEDERVKAVTWRYLLAPNRLHALIEDVLAIEAYLPHDSGTLFRHALWEWGIADDLARDKAGRLRIADRGAWRRLKKRHRREIKELSPKEERDIYAHLDHQIRQWKRLVFSGEIPPDPKCRRQIACATGVVYVLSVVLLFILTVSVLVGVSWLVYWLASWFFPQIARPTEAESWLKIGAALIAVLSFVGTQFWRWGKSIVGMYDAIYDWWALVRKKQGSLHRWNGEEKSAWIIAMQQLLFPKAN